MEKPVGPMIQNFGNTDIVIYNSNIKAERKAQTWKTGSADETLALSSM
jgi:hypothetical protein